MTPYYDDGQIQIWHGDCRDVLPRLEKGSADLIVADPPYGVNWKGRGQQGFGFIANDNGETPIFEFVRPALPVLKRHRHIYVFGLRDWSDLPIGGRCELIWDKELVGLGDLSIPWGPSHEVIAFGVYESSAAGRASGLGNLAARIRRGSVLRANRANAAAVTVHPTEKPVSILRELIESSTVFGEVVLDPFMGSGSSLVAAQLEGRRAIGIELDEGHCLTAVRRLQQSVLPLEIPA